MLNLQDILRVVFVDHQGRKGVIMKAVIDRFEDDYAVVLFGDKEIKVDLPRELLPPGAREGNWLNVTFELNPEGTTKQEEKIRGLLEKLKNKGRD